jgi:hypothetical protein
MGVFDSSLARRIRIAAELLAFLRATHASPLREDAGAVAGNRWVSTSDPTFSMSTPSTLHLPVEMPVEVLAVSDP